MNMAIHFKHKEGLVSPAWYIAVFPLIVLYYEIVFRASTVGGVFRPSALVMLLFSLSCELRISSNAFAFVSDSFLNAIIFTP